MTVTPEMIKDLRNRTGVGIGKCKEALEAAKGDIELAISNLRKAGIASAVKKEGRTTNEGQIGVAEMDNTLAIIEVNAETDFVVKNERFQEFLKNIAEEVAQTIPDSLESFVNQNYSKDSSLTINQYRADFVQTIGENIQLRRLKTFPKSADKTLGVYSHMGGKIVTVVEVAGDNAAEALARDIAMHIAAAAPDYIAPENVPADVIEHEKEIARSQITGKPENIMDKIMEGKLNAFYNQVCLLRQPFIKNDKMSISDLVNQTAKESGKTLSVTNFTRWSVGK